jgi:hypothetical protein
MVKHDRDTYLLIAATRCEARYRAQFLNATGWLAVLDAQVPGVEARLSGKCCHFDHFFTLAFARAAQADLGIRHVGGDARVNTWSTATAMR